MYLIAAGYVCKLKYLGRTKTYPSIASKLFHLKNEALINHFSAQLWQLTWHGGSFILMLAVMVPSDFWPAIINPYGGTSLLWDYPDTLPSLGIRILYLIHIGYYATDFIYMWAKDRPNDLYVMSAHHLAALSLLWMSYLPPPCWKIGCAVLWVHEIGDVSLYLCKTLHYGQIEMTANILFVINIMIWIWARLIWLPRIILSFYVYDIPDIGNSNIWQIWPCGILLWILCLLHCYWCFLMTRVLYNALFKGEAMADDRDKDNPMKDREKRDIEADGDNGGRKPTFDDNMGDKDKVNLDDLQTVEIDEKVNADKPPMMRRRSSLMGSFIESKENIITPTNKRMVSDAIFLYRVVFVLMSSREK